MNKWLGIALLTFAWVCCCKAEGIVDELRTSSVSRFEFGLYRLQAALDSWAKEFKEYPGIEVRVAIDSADKIHFSVSKAQPFYHAVEEGQVRKMCDEVMQHLAIMILGNHGDPALSNVRGENMYYLSWGSYFAPLGTSAVKIQEIGKVASVGSEIHIYTANSELEVCEYDPNRPYKR